MNCGYIIMVDEVVITAVVQATKKVVRSFFNRCFTLAR